jgi:hypothetical protein
VDISPDEEEIFSVVRFMARVKERLKLSLLILNIAACGPLSNAVCAFVARPCPITEPYLIILRAIDENQPPERTSISIPRFVSLVEDILSPSND